MLDMRTRNFGVWVQLGGCKCPCELWSIGA